MNKYNKEVKADNRNDSRVAVDAGTTVVVHCGDHEIIGTIENRSEGGLGLIIPESSIPLLQQDQVIDVAYSMPYGLVNQQVQVCWSQLNQRGELCLGTSFFEADSNFQSNYQKLWKHFSTAEKLEDAARYWLRLQCAMLSGVSRGVIVLGKPDSGSYAPVSFWPEGQRGTLGLTEVAELALQERRGVLRDEGQFNKSLNFPVCYVGYPLMLDDKLCGVVAIEMMVRSEPMMRAVMRQLQWGASWIELATRRIEGKKYSPESYQLSTVLELIVSSLEHEKFQAAATSVATELATVLECERVSIGFLKGKNIKVRALSHSADFAEKSKLLQSIERAMDEAMDQRISILYPPVNDETVQIHRCHQLVLQEQGISSICTIPLSSENKVYGAITLERSADKLFTKETLELCETIATLVGPILEAKRREDLWLISKAGLSIKSFVQHVLGEGYAGLKLACITFIALVLFFIFASGDYRITANTNLEGAIQRVIVTPFDGYISEAYVRAGDIVKKDITLVKMDDNDLVLERTKWESQKKQLLNEYRDALGRAERSKISILKARLGQVDAQLAMLDAQLSRIQLKAPFDGIIVSGDLSQSLGSPTQRGEVLFEIAPLDVYRVILEVDERDISEIVVGQTGELVLTGRSDKVIDFNVTHITPVSESKEGRNYFRVEAKLDQELTFLRPGMKGVGKILIGERKLIWIWSRTLVDWLRLAFWTWWPQGL